jgi:hypothetical protein
VVLAIAIIPSVAAVEHVIYAGAAVAVVVAGVEMVYHRYPFVVAVVSVVTWIVVGRNPPPTVDAIRPYKSAVSLMMSWMMSWRKEEASSR